MVCGERERKKGRLRAATRYVPSSGGAIWAPRSQATCEQCQSWSKPPRAAPMVARHHEPCCRPGLWGMAANRRAGQVVLCICRAQDSTASGTASLKIAGSIRSWPHARPLPQAMERNTGPHSKCRRGDWLAAGLLACARPSPAQSLKGPIYAVGHADRDDNRMSNGPLSSIARGQFFPVQVCVPSESDAAARAEQNTGGRQSRGRTAHHRRNDWF